MSRTPSVCTEISTLPRLGNEAWQTEQKLIYEVSSESCPSGAGLIFLIYPGVQGGVSDLLLFRQLLETYRVEHQNGPENGSPNGER